MENSIKNKDYLDGPYLDSVHWSLTDRSLIIVEYFRRYVDKTDSILELGCSAGRNLKFLADAGYKNVTGLEMSDKAVKQCTFPVIHGEYTTTPHGEYDVIFSASFLQEFSSFPQERFEKSLENCNKFFMIFGDAMPEFKVPAEFEIIELRMIEPFTKPIIILKRVI